MLVLGLVALRVLIVFGAVEEENAIEYRSCRIKDLREMQ